MGTIPRIAQGKGAGLGARADEAHGGLSPDSRRHHHLQHGGHGQRRDYRGLGVRQRRERQPCQDVDVDDEQPGPPGRGRGLQVARGHGLHRGRYDVQQLHQGQRRPEQLRQPPQEV